MEEPHAYLNTKNLDYDINPLISWKWHNAINPKKKISSTKTYKNEEEAWDSLVKEVAPQEYLTAHDIGIKWKLTIKGNIDFEGSQFYADKNRAVIAWRQAKTLANSPKNFTLHKKDKQLRLTLRNEKGKVIATSNEIAGEKLNVEGLVADCVRVFVNRSTRPRYENQPAKFGFKIQRKKGAHLLSSYCVYDSEKEALREMRLAFELGKTARNYLKSGDEGNPEYNFILKDQQNGFLAAPPQDLETATDRDKALRSTTQFFKTTPLPLNVKEEPRRYSWTLYDKKEIAFASGAEFSSKAKAQANLNRELCQEASKGSSELLARHRFELKIKPVAVNYKFIYGRGNAQNELEPLFISKTSFNTVKKASKAYSEFAKILPALEYKSNSKKGRTYDYALFEKENKNPIAVQYRMEKEKASSESAKELFDYITAIYTKSGAPRERFIRAEMLENREAKYEWRFYKKNAPLAKSPYLCPDRVLAERLKLIICDVVPPISLRECPPKKKVVCPEKDPGKFHYQVCFGTNDGREFSLISYCGYDTDEAAKEAWQKEWLEVIDLARDPVQYLVGGKIGVFETYKNEASTACGQSDPIAVIPEMVTRRLTEDGTSVVDYHQQLANLFPIYKVDDENDKECNNKYQYRVTVSDENFLNIDCLLDYTSPYQGSLLWVSVECYENIEEVIAAYQHFYTLAGSSNNCRILCERGNFCVGLVEVFAESACKYESETEAWDDTFPKNRDLCNSCVPGGVREFLYAAEEDRNYIISCDQQWWKFKVVSPSYFVVDHMCCYNSEDELKEEMKIWTSRLEALKWTDFITKTPDKKKMSAAGLGFMTAAASNSKVQIFKDLCELILIIRDCLQLCEREVDPTISPKMAFIRCLRDKFGDDERIDLLEEDPNFNLDNLIRFTNYFPVYKTDKGYCYRLYWEPNDKVVSEVGLQPCECDDQKRENSDSCSETFPFISSNCYDCCEEALKAFIEFIRLIRAGSFNLECVIKSEYGPYSFQLIDTSKELAYHPQQYDCKQDVLNAIDITKACVNNTGMHLLEHILLRPTKAEECGRLIMIGDNEFRRSDDCLLPICPDYCCPIPWQPDLDKNDPCAEEPEIIHYLPGYDPYSFWATLVLPSWVKRFRTRETRQSFETFLYKEVPALVGLNILWLGPRDMCKFETAYRKWLDWMQDRELKQCPPNDGPPHCALVDCIKELDSELPCPSAPDDQADCDCDCNEPREYDPCCLPPDTVGSIFWGDCLPESDPDPNDGPVLFSENLAIENTTAVSVEKPKSVRNKITAKRKEKPKGRKPADEKALMANIRKRRSRYLIQVQALADDSKSFERALFFVKNNPTVKAYKDLVAFFGRYSLPKDNRQGPFFNMIRQATYHLLDNMALIKTGVIASDTLKELEESLNILKEKGLSPKEIKKEWNSKELSQMANSETVKQLNKILK